MSDRIKLWQLNIILSLLSRFKKTPFLGQIWTCDESEIIYDSQKKKKHWLAFVMFHWPLNWISSKDANSVCLVDHCWLEARSKNHRGWRLLVTFQKDFGCYVPKIASAGQQERISSFIIMPAILQQTWPGTFSKHWTGKLCFIHFIFWTSSHQTIICFWHW